MSFKILTYKDPYNLRKEKFWNEIRKYPHLCSSTSLVQGMESLYSEDMISLICTIDNVVSKHFQPWSNDFEFYIRQYTALSEIIKKLSLNKNPGLISAIKSNQNDFLNSIRLIKELGINSKEINSNESLRDEHLMLLEILQIIEKDGQDVFSIPDISSTSMKSTFINIVQSFLDERSSESEMNAYKKSKMEFVAKYLEENDLKKIVVHGLHQFKPLMYLMFKDFSDKGGEVIFLFNYLEKYNNIYETWANIYSILEIPFTKEDEKNVVKNQFVNLSRKIAEKFGDFSNGDNVVDTLPELNIMSFENSLEFSNYIANIYEKGLAESPENPFNSMTEHFFAGRSDLNDILKIYFPEQYRERHFFSYPIGRFFSEIYNLWDDKSKVLKFDFDSFKEILTSGVLTGKPGLNPMGTYNKLSLYFKGIKTLPDARIRLNLLLTNIREIESEKDRKNDYEYLKKYDFHTADSREIENLIEILDDMEVLAENLFTEDAEDELHFGNHYKKIDDFLDNRYESITLQEEKKLVNALSKKLFHAKELNIKSSFDDLKSSIVYYLKQSGTIEEYGNLVKSLEHLEGGIWKSKLKNNDFVYHIGMLSDKKLQLTANNVLPWPLSTEFFDSVYTPSGYSYQLYITSLNEYSSFIRYQLFHGWYFNNCQIKLSYVKDTGEDETNKPYYFLELLGAKITKSYQAVDDEWRNPIDADKEDIGIEPSDFSDYNPGKLDAQLFKLCPYKFFNEIILDQSEMSGLNNEYLCKLFFYQIHLLYNVWSKVNGISIDIYEKSIDQILEEEIENTKKYFPFLSTTADYFDIRHKFKKYFQKNCLDSNNGVVRLVDYNFINIKKNFIYNKYVDSNGKNKVSFLGEIEKGRIGIADILETISNYMENDDIFIVNPDEWCAQCKCDGYCMSREY